MICCKLFLLLLGVLIQSQKLGMIEIIDFDKWIWMAAKYERKNIQLKMQRLEDGRITNGGLNNKRQSCFCNREYDYCCLSCFHLLKKSVYI